MKGFVIICLLVFHLAAVSCATRDELNTLAVAEAIHLMRPYSPTHVSERIGGTGGVPEEFQNLAETANTNLLLSTGATTLDPSTVKASLICPFVNRDGRQVYIYDDVVVIQATGATLESTFAPLRDNYLLKCCAYDTFAVASSSTDFDSDGEADFYALTVIAVALSSIPTTEVVASLPLPQGTCVPPCGEIASTGGPVEVTVATDVLVQGFLENDDYAFIVPERRAVYLEDDLEVDFVPSFGTYSTIISEVLLPNGKPGYEQGATDTAGVIPAGTTVSTYLFHYDPVGTLSNFTTVRDLSITFTTPIVGVAARGTPPFGVPTVLDSTDGEFGRACTDYRTVNGTVQTWRGIEMALLNAGPPREYEAESFTVSGNTITIHTVHVINEAVDQLRIFVACNDTIVCRGIVGTSGGVVEIDPPSVLDVDSVTSYTEAFVFRERSYQVGSAGVAVDTKFANEDGTPTCEGRCELADFDGSGDLKYGLVADLMTTAETTTILPGARVQSFLVRADLPVGPNLPYTTISGCIEFGNTIIGVIWSAINPSPANLLPASDDVFGDLCTSYETTIPSTNRGLDDNGNAEPSDIVWLNSPTELCFTVRARTTSVDDFRVLTLCGY